MPLHRIAKRFAIVLAWGSLSAASPTMGSASSNSIHDLDFDVFRDDVRVGRHTVSFTSDGEGLRVRAEFRLAVKLLGFTLYAFEYDSRSHWRYGRLQSLEAQTNDDGEVSFVRARLDGETTQVSGPAGTVLVNGELIPTNHWNFAVTRSNRVLNTITGKVNEVRMRHLGVETVMAEGNAIEAHRWAYTGDLENEVWYDRDGRWVKMRFFGKDRSTIEYICRRCLGPLPRLAN